MIQLPQMVVVNSSSPFMRWIKSYGFHVDTSVITVRTLWYERARLVIAPAKVTTFLTTIQHQIPLYNYVLNTCGIT